MTERGQAVVLVVGGMLLGAGVTTLVLKKHYQKIADAEIASVKTTYKEHYERLNGQGLIKDVDEAEPDIEGGETPVVSNVSVPPVVAPREPVAYHKIRTSDEKREEAEKLASTFGYSTVTREVPESINAFNFEQHLSPAEEEELNDTIEDEGKDPNTPFIISVDEFMADDAGHEQINLTYFAMDKRLCDDRDILVEDVRSRVGFSNLDKFGGPSGNDDTLYVRNNRLKIDYEICRENSSYAQDVLGEDYVEDPKAPKVKKFRNGD